jgi:hypothetical protein
MNDRAGLAPTDKGTSDLACTLDDTCPGILSHSFVSGLQRLQEEVEKHHEINNDQETHLTELLGHIRMLDAPNSQFRTSTTEDKRERLEGYRTNLKDCRFEASKSETFLSSRHDQAEKALAEKTTACDHLRTRYDPRTYTGFQNMVFQSPSFAEVESALNHLEQMSTVAVASELSRGSAKSDGGSYGVGALSENDGEFRQSARSGR